MDNRLFLAVLHHNLELLQNLHEQGCPIHMMADRDMDQNIIRGFTPLMVAARVDAFHCLEYLVKQGANVNEWSKSAYPTTALRQAAWFGRVNCVRYLLDHVTDINEQHSIYGETALMEAFHISADREPALIILDHFLEKGADLAIENYRGETLFDIARGFQILDKVQEAVSTREKTVLLHAIDNNGEANEPWLTF